MFVLFESQKDKHRGTEAETESEILSCDFLLKHPNSQGWARTKPREKISIQVSLVADKDTDSWATSAAFQEVRQQKTAAERKPGVEPTLISDVGIPCGVLNTMPNTWLHLSILALLQMK